MKTFKNYITEGVSDFIIHSASGHDFFTYMGNDTYVANKSSKETAGGWLGAALKSEPPPTSDVYNNDVIPITSILGPDAVKKWPYFMSFARTKTGKYRIAEDKHITLVLDADKIRNIRGVKLFGAFDFFKTNQMKSGSSKLRAKLRNGFFEFEDRILLKDKHLTNFNKYIKEIHIKNGTFDLYTYKLFKDDFMEYIKKNGIPTWQHTKGSWKSINKNRAEKIN